SSRLIRMDEKTKVPLVAPLSRRRLLTGAGGLAMTGLLASAPVFSRDIPRIEVPEGNVQPVPIALPDFAGSTPAESETGRNITQVITGNLRRSGLFVPIDQAAYIEKVTNFDVAPRFPDWRVINAQALVTGRLRRPGGDGRLQIEFRLWDVFAGQQLAGQQ